MKLLAVVVCTVLFTAVCGKRFETKCVLLDVNGTVTVTAKNTKTNETEKKVIDLSKDEGTTSGNCSKADTVTMTVAFNNVTKWMLVFNRADNKVELVQSLTFDPATLFNSSSMNDSATLDNKNPLALSSSNASYLCDTQQTIAFKPKEEGGYRYTVSQSIAAIQVQAFGLTNGTFSPAEHCAADKSTVAPTTEPTTVPATTEPVPTVQPVKPETYVVKDTKGNVCFRLDAGLQFAVQYETTDKTMVFSKVMTIHDTANVTGKCANGSGNTASMTIAENDYSLTITETRTGASAVSAISLTVTLDPANFPKAAQANKSVSFSMTKQFELSSADTFYQCDTQQVLKFDNSSTTLYTDDVKLQAFNLKNGSFNGQGVHCGLDPTPSPMPPATTPGDNTYTVREGNITCIVLQGEITFSNVTYDTKSGSAHAGLLSIPAMNETTGNVKFSGSCKAPDNRTQQLVVTFNKNWTLTLTFARGSSKDSSMLTATADEYSVRDIEFVYYLLPAFFPNASSPYTKVVAKQMNITSDFMKGSTNGGSYKCNAQQTEMLDNGIEFQTANFQYKAFNNDNSTTFSNKVTECSADDKSNSIVPIAVGAALAGLVAIVLIAYLIGRRRSRRQGYESV